MVGDENMRIGDSEREAAVSALQDHLAAGRLTPEEFNERMDKAFEARTSHELEALFRDLPGGGGQSGMAQPVYPDPYAEMEPTYPSQAPAQWGETPYEVQESSGGKPWYAQWWILLIAIFLAGAGSGRLAFLVPMVAIWIWVIYPSIAKNRAARQVAPSGPPRPLTYAERDEVIVALHSRGEVAAIKRYRELTGADLYTATMTVRAMNRELGH